MKYNSTYYISYTYIYCFGHRPGGISRAWIVLVVGNSHLTVVSLLVVCYHIYTYIFISLLFTDLYNYVIFVLLISKRFGSVISLTQIIHYNEL